MTRRRQRQDDETGVGQCNRDGGGRHEKEDGERGHALAESYLEGGE
jgi:hypothetical protein